MKLYGDVITWDAAIEAHRRIDGGLIYLASPYSDPDPQVRKVRSILAEHHTVRLIEAELQVLSPIVYTHRLVTKYRLPHDFDYWRQLDMQILWGCDAVWVLLIAGWDTSRGVRAEIKNARTWCQPCYVLPHNIKADSAYARAIVGRKSK